MKPQVNIQNLRRQPFNMFNKNHPIMKTGSILAVALLAASMSSPARDIHKANNTQNLNLGASWSEGHAPGSGGVGVWDSTVTGPNAVTLGADTNWLGLKLLSPGGAVTIAAGNTLTLGASGIDMSSATTNLALNCNLALGAAQPWNVASGLSLSVGGQVSGASGAGLTLAGSGTLLLTNANTYTGGTAITGGALSLQAPGSLGTGALSLSGGGKLQLLGAPGGSVVAVSWVASSAVASSQFAPANEPNKAIMNPFPPPPPGAIGAESAGPTPIPAGRLPPMAARSPKISAP
jgi:autotransporter-associated beta strand protein